MPLAVALVIVGFFPFLLLGFLLLAERIEDWLLGAPGTPQSSGDDVTRRPPVTTPRQASPAPGRPSLPPAPQRPAPQRPATPIPTHTVTVAQIPRSHDDGELAEHRRRIV